MFLTRDAEKCEKINLKYTFDFFDHDGDGYITYNDLRRCINPKHFDKIELDIVFKELRSDLGENVRRRGIDRETF